jgi:tetratricopeptide (TPR) repeat protein
VIAHQTGDNQRAVQLITRAVNSNPKLISAYNNLGVALAELGQAEDAIDVYQKALSLKQNYPEAHNNCGNALCDLGRNVEAVSCYRKAVALKPNYTEAHNNLGNALRALGEHHKAVTSYRNAIKINPSFMEAYSGLGMAYSSLGQWDEAAACFKRVIQNTPHHAEAQNNLGNALKAKGRVEEAIASYRSAISINPSYAEAYKNLGVALEHSGNLSEAKHCYREAISIQPSYAEAYRHLSSAKRHTEHDDDIQVMEQLFADGSISDEQCMHLGFALGKAFEDLKDYAKSFDYISEANRIKRKTYDYSTSEARDYFTRVKEVFSPEFFSAHREVGVSDETPIFILGMPRSGTTLVEQIIASHPQVFGAGELGYMGQLARALCPKGSIFPDISSALDGEDFSKLGAEYLEKLREHSTDAIYITDKMPHNFLYIGVIVTALPNARIIHCNRDPLDTCLSIYKNYFADAHKYAYDLVELGEYYLLYSDLMQHWQENLPGVIYDIDYEKLISDQEDQTRKLLEQCGLPWDDSCLKFHKTERSVQTASSSQVRQPIYSRSVRLSERYGARLEELRGVLYPSKQA